jgi:hypothetical protein
MNDAWSILWAKFEGKSPLARLGFEGDKVLE